MKIGVVGCGAVGSFYGAKLCRAGHEVHFLLRSDYEAVRLHGVQVLSPEGNFLAFPRPARNPREVGGCDLVLVALKTTANDQFSVLIPALLQADTRVLTLQNGLGNEERLASLFGPERVLGGLCFVCLNRVTPGVVRHLAHGPPPCSTSNAGCRWNWRVCSWSHSAGQKTPGSPCRDCPPCAPF